MTFPLQEIHANRDYFLNKLHAKNRGTMCEGGGGRHV
jgi:hypothetical protein